MSNFTSSMIIPLYIPDGNVAISSSDNAELVTLILTSKPTLISPRAPNPHLHIQSRTYIIIHHPTSAAGVYQTCW